MTWMELVVFGIFGKKPNKQEKYLIEFRLGGHSKKILRDFRDKIEARFGANFKKHMVPHITIAGQLSTDDGKRLLREIESVAEKYGPPSVRLGGFGIFLDRAIYVDVRPSEDLVMMRNEIVERLKKFCKMAEWDNKEYVPHATLCTSNNFPGLSDEDINQTFNEIAKFLDKSSTFEAKSCVVRITVIGRENKIVGEYDLLLKKMLSRDEALDKSIYKKTMELKKYKHC